jgi:hypothetical protein
MAAFSSAWRSRHRHGAMRLSHPIELPAGPMLLAAAGGLITEPGKFMAGWRM